MSAKPARVIRALNVQYKDGDKLVDLFKGDELPSNAPKDLVALLVEQGGLEPLDGASTAEISQESTDAG